MLEAHPGLHASETRSLHGIYRERDLVGYPRRFLTCLPLHLFGKKGGCKKGMSIGIPEYLQRLLRKTLLGPYHTNKMSFLFSSAGLSLDFVVTAQGFKEQVWLTQIVTVTFANFTRLLRQVLLITIFEALYIICIAAC